LRKAVEAAQPSLEHLMSQFAPYRYPWPAWQLLAALWLATIATWMFCPQAAAQTPVGVAAAASAAVAANPPDPGVAQTTLGSKPIELDDRIGEIEVWPVVQTWWDESGTADLTQAQSKAREAAFASPKSSHQSLGMHAGAMWLRVPFSTGANTNGNWVLDVDYPLINRIDVHLTTDGQELLRATMGGRQPKDDRTVQARALNVGLVLKPNTAYELYLRVEHEGPMILPIRLAKPSPFLKRALAEQMLQGLLMGLGLSLLIYSFGQWITLGEPMFVKYALLISGSLLFSLHSFGVGAQYLWLGNGWMGQRAGGLAACMASAGSFLFVEQALAGKDLAPWMSKAMKGGAMAMAVIGLLFGLEVLTISQITNVVGVMGLLPAALGLPGALRKARRGESVGFYFLVGWAVYLISTAIVVEVIKGNIGANFWTLHSFQFGATLDMLIFMRVLGLQTRAIKVAAQQAKLERDSFHSLAHTDPLTGLPNRRVVNSAIGNALAAMRPGEHLAVLMLDLDGFKQVNDQQGHDVGDDLLVAVANRLRAKLRGSDVVMRLGGDEFLVLTSDLKHAQQAQELGEALVQSIAVPFDIEGHVCEVSLTIGCALAPDDATDTRTLLHMADAAMYAGKQAGKNRFHRAHAEPG
jgi:diguanylate cyclase